MALGDLLSAVMIFIVIAVASMIGGAMIAKTQNVTLGIAPGSTLINTLATDTGGALSTLTSLLSIVALAIVGGLALRFLYGFLGGGGSVM